MVARGLKVAHPRFFCLTAAAILSALAGGLLRADDPPAAEVPATAASQPRNSSAADALTDAKVVSAIEHGISYLIADLDKKLPEIKKLPPASRGDPKRVNEPGELMLEAYALLHVGPDVKDARLLVQDPRMKLLAEVALKLDSDSNYVTCLQTLTLAQLPQTAEVKQALARTVAKLVQGRTKTGGYGYGLTKGAEIHDQSNSQYALLAIWAAADWGTFPPASYWKETDEFWRGLQLPNGGWGYGGIPEAQVLKDAPTRSMTTAGIASLYICDEFLNRTPRLVPRSDTAIDDGVAAMMRDFDPTTADFYYLYGVERVGLATGHKFFGKVDWYREIAANLLKRQKADGSFDGNFPGANGPRSTCYAILLLARGRSPVLMNKLEYNGPWNARPRDSANVHAELAKATERHLNWQSVPIDVSPQQWLDAPILLITGSKDPQFTSDDLDKLRQFITAGGIIFSSPDGGSKEFTAAIEKYAAQVLGVAATGEHGPFRQLPADHPLFSSDGKMTNPPTLYGVSNGLRELWIHSPTDYGGIWQSRDKSNPEAWVLPMMLFSYAAGKGELRSKLQPLSVPAPAKEPARQATVAMLSYDGNWNPEPGAWPRLVKLMAFDAGTTLTLKEVPVEDLSKMAAMPALAHLAGTGKLTLSLQQQASLVAYVNAGGTLFVESLGCNDAFSKSADELLRAMFPGVGRKLVPPNYTLFAGDFSRDAIPIKQVAYRRDWTLVHGQQTAPRLEYMTVNNRIGIFISGEDITSGLLGTNTSGIGGYMPDDAVAIARNLVLYAARNAPKPHPAKAAPASQPGAATAAGK